MNTRVPLAVATCDFRQSGARGRSDLVLSAGAQHALYEALASQGVTGFVQLHTCNRLEWWVSAQDVDWACQLLRTAWRRQQSGLTQTVEPRIHRGEAAVEHLFRVSVGLESLIQGEREVRGQVRRALQAAHDAKHSSPELNIAASAAGRLAAKVRHEMPQTVATPGMHSLVADLVEEEVSTTGHVLVIGMGEIGKRCADTLERRGYPVSRMNRSPGPGQPYQSLDCLPEALKTASAAVFCSASPDPLLRPGMLGAGRSPWVFDLGSPAQVDSVLADELKAQYWGLDELTTCHRVVLPSPAQERLEELVEGAVTDYLERLAHHRFRSLAQSNQTQLEQVISDDLPGLLDQHAGSLNAKARRLLEHELRRLFRRQAWSVRESLVALNHEKEPSPFRLPHPEHEPC